MINRIASHIFANHKISVFSEKFPLLHVNCYLVILYFFYYYLSFKHPDKLLKLTTIVKTIKNLIKKVFKIRLDIF
jgi:hypothetical protein